MVENLISGLAFDDVFFPWWLAARFGLKSKPDIRKMVRWLGERMDGSMGGWEDWWVDGRKLEKKMWAKASFLEAGVCPWCVMLWTQVWQS